MLSAVRKQGEAWQEISKRVPRESQKVVQTFAEMKKRKRRKVRRKREEVRSRMVFGTTTKKSRHQMPGKGRKKKAAELWGFAAWNVRDGVLRFNVSVVPWLEILVLEPLIAKSKPIRLRRFGAGCSLR